MREDEQRFPAWPLITAVVRHSRRTGSYTARIDYPSTPARILKRAELQPLRSEVITQVQRWTNDEWHKPIRLQVDDPDGHWLLGIPRDGAPVELDALVPDPPPAAARRRRAAHFTLADAPPRIRGRRLAATVILATAAVVLIVAVAIPRGFSATRHHQTVVTHTVKAAVVAVSPAAAGTTPRIVTPASKLTHRHTAAARRSRTVSRRRAQSRRRTPHRPHRAGGRSRIRRSSTATSAAHPPASRSRTRPATATRSARPSCPRPTSRGRIPPAAC